MAIHYTSPALRVQQPIGEFYVTKIPASVLLDVTYSDPLRIRSRNENTGYSLAGNQRIESQRRLSEIRRYIETVEATFPNSIILAANYDENDSLIDDDTIRWRIEETDSSCLNLIIPTSKKLASIVDGQHRMHAFESASQERKSMDLVCTVFLDLPNPFQAFIFATINFNQKRVDKSLAYEMFGYDLDTENTIAWSPDKLAVLLARKLNTEDLSPFKGHIQLAPRDSTRQIVSVDDSDSWTVSMAGVVDGILKLFSQNPHRDKDKMHGVSADKRSRKILEQESDRSPLRSWYIASNDLAIYTVLLNYFTAVSRVFWSNQYAKDLKKSVSVQALFDVLMHILTKRLALDKDISVQYFESRLEKAKNIDFSQLFEASGAGRVKIRNAILEQIDLSL